MNLKDTELNNLIRDVVWKIRNYGPREARNQVKRLRDAGLMPNLHVGKSEMEMTIRLRLEWYAGQVLDAWDQGTPDQFARVINDVDKFTTR